MRIRDVAEMRRRRRRGVKGVKAHMVVEERNGMVGEEALLATGQGSPAATKSV